MYLATIIAQSLVLGTQVLMVALSLYLVYAASRIVHIAIGATGVASAYALYAGLAAGWPLTIALLGALALAAVIGIGAAQMLEPFAVKQEPLMGLLASFALGLAVEYAVAIIFGTDGKSLQPSVLAVSSIAGADIDVPGIVTIALGAALALVAWVVVHFTNVGRTLRSIAENPSLTTTLGVNTKAIRRAACVAASLVGASAIILTGWHTALTPLMGFQLVIAAFIALLMGGVHDLRGTVIASYLIALVPGLIIGFSPGLSENWRFVFVFAIAAVVLALRPHGIFSKRIREA